ncbi:uncharacterized protein N7482_001089 [Penicillium canariense]|uniref:C2H2-type domain-containing protein n=1 Tax=Penicillium canariense TaxID=189055 RepID=A0A9W9IF54_9EURO|nr:uncharacterized protein N7482_001089 [Penicillium canariense]KAJ5175212.1 hypothetical protein N7482_001089 [Penicillium canariense]
MTRYTYQSVDPFFLLSGQVSNEPLQSNKRSIFIAIMGMTGAGKSTFISHCTDAKVAISDPGALHSCTQEVQVYRCKDFTPHTNVYLVDTPGFDDTDRKDTDILKEIATWLTTTYKKEIHLSGILYLHRISDNRMGGCARRNLVMFKKLCGPEGIKSVIFLTTFWEKVDGTDGDNREKTLRTTDEFWGYFVDRGARVQRHWNTDDSAMAAIQNFVPSDTTEPPEEIKLAIQTEMVDLHKDLDQTSAGQELQSELQKEREQMQTEFNERAREIHEEKDQEMRDLLQEDQERQAKELQRRDSEIQELKISMERMHEKKIQQLEERLLEQQNENRRHREEMEQIIRQHREDIQEIQCQRNQDVEHLTQEIRHLKTSNTQCLDCYETFTSASELFDHKQTKHNQIDQQQIQYEYDPDANDEEEYEEEDIASDNGSECWEKTNTTATTPSQNGGNHDVDPYLTCLACRKEFSNRQDLFKHLEKFQHGRDLVTGKPKKYARPPGFQVPEIDPWLTCLACEEEFSDRNDLFEHIEEFQHGRDLVTGTPEEYVRPYGYQDDEVDPYLTCLACEENFSSRDDLFEHIEEFQHGRNLLTGKPR